MITRRRCRTVNNAEVQSLDVQVADAVETVEDITTTPVGFPPDDFDNAGIELDDLLEIDDFKWALERETSSPLFDVELAHFGVYNASDQDSVIEASSALSPERISSALKCKNRQEQASNMINKNAIAARLNRLKKKEYVNSLEKKVGILSTENNMLKQKNSELTKRVDELEDETRGQTQMITTMPYPGSVSKLRRKRHLVACVCMWTRTMSQWSSALSVQRVQAHHSKCRVKYLHLFSDIKTDLDRLTAVNF